MLLNDSEGLSVSARPPRSPAVTTICCARLWTLAEGDSGPRPEEKTVATLSVLIMGPLFWPQLTDTLAVP